MNLDISDPQIFYMILILPSLFGLMLIGEGLHKLIKSDFGGWFSLISGVIFIGAMVFAYLYIGRI